MSEDIAVDVPVSDASGDDAGFPRDSAPVSDAEPANDFKTIDSQEALENVLKGRLERANKSAEKKYQKQIEELASQLKSYEDDKLSADEKKEKRLAELEQSLSEATDRYTKLERTRLVESLAREMGLPEKFWGRVQGSNDDEIISDINDMLEGLPRVEKPSGIPSQTPKMSVQATGTDPDVEESAKNIVDKLGSRFSF